MIKFALGLIFGTLVGWYFLPSPPALDQYVVDLIAKYPQAEPFVQVPVMSKAP